MSTAIKHLVTYICLALNCKRGTASAVYGLLLGAFAVIILSGCCGPWWFCEGHHHHNW